MTEHLPEKAARSILASSWRTQCPPMSTSHSQICLNDTTILESRREEDCSGSAKLI